MWIKAICDFDCPTHNVKAGQIADIAEHIAKELIEERKAEPIEVERAIAAVAGKEQATVDPIPGKRGGPVRRAVQPNESDPFAS